MTQRTNQTTVYSESSSPTGEKRPQRSDHSNVLASVAALLGRRPAVIAMTLLLLVTACAAGPDMQAGGVAVSPDAANGDAPMQKPFVVKEADLPKGFPQPGPVGTIVMKDYPAYRLAVVREDAAKSANGNSQNRMFRPLFNHIKRNDIPMTAPVEIGYAGSVDNPDNDAGTSDQRQPNATSMAFLYGDPSWGEPGNDRKDPQVIVEDIPAMTVLSIGVRGGYDKSFAKALTTLNDWVAENPSKVRVVGPPRYMAYNSPFVPGFLKYGEVQLPIECTAENQVGTRTN
jgi:hypothetical protein